MKNYFTDGEMSALWSRLNTSIKSAGKGCAEMWLKLKDKPQRSRKNAAKQNALMLKLTKPDVWKEMMQSEIREFIRVDKLETQEVPKSKGELEMIHGKEEAHELINKGWFNTVTIKGVTHYIKRTATNTQGTELRHTKKGEQRSSVDEDATQMMDSEFGSMAMTWDFDDAEKPRPCPKPLADAEESEHQQAEDQAASSKEEQPKKKPKKNPNDPKKADEHSELKKKPLWHLTPCRRRSRRAWQWCRSLGRTGM